MNDLSRTAAAIERRDRLVPLVWSAIDRMLERPCGRAREDSIKRAYGLLDRIERTVGIAFGLDTDRAHGGPNDPEVCAKLIRAGEPTPPIGSSLSFVRRAVRRWQRERDAV